MITTKRQITKREILLIGTPVCYVKFGDNWLLISKLLDSCKFVYLSHKIIIHR